MMSVLLDHLSTVALAAIQKCGFQLFEHPTYSLDLATSDYYLFLKVKKELGSRHFATDDDITNDVDHVLRYQMAPSTQMGSVCSMTAGLSVLI